MNIMVMAGTSDAVKLIRRIKLLGNDVHIIATTVTSYGADIAKSAGADEVISKPLPQDELTTIILNRNIDVLVDATHPFAADATRNAIKASKDAGIRYLRLERPVTVVPESDLIYIASSFVEAAQMAKKITKNRILHLAGVSTLHHIVSAIDPDRIVARILPSTYSIEKCLELGLSSENIIAMQGTFSKEFNQALMMEYQVGVVITKDSGVTGGTPSKLEAALDLKIPVIMVERPVIPELKTEKVSNSVEKLLLELRE